jgi:hypothetical protein
MTIRNVAKVVLSAHIAFPIAKQVVPFAICVGISKTEIPMSYTMYSPHLTDSVWEQLPNPNIRNCEQIGRSVKNEPDIELAIADEIQNFKEYGVP